MEPLLLREEAAEILRRPVSWLQYAEQKRLIPFVRVGRLVRYRRADLEAWVDAQAQAPTSQALTSKLDR